MTVSLPINQGLETDLDHLDCWAAKAEMLVSENCYSKEMEQRTDNWTVCSDVIFVYIFAVVKWMYCFLHNEFKMQPLHVLKKTYIRNVALWKKFMLFQLDKTNRWFDLMFQPLFFLYLSVLTVFFFFFWWRKVLQCFCIHTGCITKVEGHSQVSALQQFIRAERIWRHVVGRGSRQADWDYTHQTPQKNAQCTIFLSHCTVCCFLQMTV